MHVSMYTRMPEYAHARVKEDLWSNIHCAHSWLKKLIYARPSATSLDFAVTLFERLIVLRSEPGIGNWRRQ